MAAVKSRDHTKQRQAIVVIPSLVKSLRMLVRANRLDSDSFALGWTELVGVENMAEVVSLLRSVGASAHTDGGRPG